MTQLRVVQGKPHLPAVGKAHAERVVPCLQNIQSVAQIAARLSRISLTAPRWPSLNSSRTAPSTIWP